MHQKYAKDGLVCISVNIDEADRKDRALAFLKSSGATFPNYLLDEETQIWQDKWDLAGPPCVFVFNRNNQRVQKLEPEPGKSLPAEVEKLVQKLLAEGK